MKVPPIGTAVHRRAVARTRILAIVNPAAGPICRVRLRPILDRLEALGCLVTVYETHGAGDAKRYVRSVDHRAFDAIAVAGGDGTFNEVLNGLPQGGPPLAVLPLGTVNVLAREIGLPSSIEGIAETVVFGRSRPVSIGEVNGRRFAVMASVGLDAEVVERVNLDLKRRIGKGAYVLETMKRMALASPPTFRLRTGGREHRAHGIIVANGRFYAGGYVTSPKAAIEKPCFDVCRLTGSGRAAAPRYLLSLLAGRFAERDDVHIDEATALDILGPAGAPVQADGDVIGRLPASVRLLPSAVEIIFPTTLSRPRGVLSSNRFAAS